MCFMNSFGQTVILLAIALFFAQTMAGTWTDSTGKYKIEGEFVKLVDGQVEIRRDDGKLVRIPLNKLSAPDQQHVRNVHQAAKDDRSKAAGDGEKEAQIKLPATKPAGSPTTSSPRPQAGAAPADWMVAPRKKSDPLPEPGGAFQARLDR